jgi:hypothetical protein
LACVCMRERTCMHTHTHTHTNLKTHKISVK